MNEKLREKAEKYAQETQDRVNAERVAPGRPEPVMVPQDVIDEYIEAHERG